jgi:hypothetical protein
MLTGMSAIQSILGERLGISVQSTLFASLAALAATLVAVSSSQSCWLAGICSDAVHYL